MGSASTRFEFQLEVLTVLLWRRDLTGLGLIFSTALVNERGRGIIIPVYGLFMKIKSMHIKFLAQCLTQRMKSLINLLGG